MSRIEKVMGIILAGGLGERLRPLTGERAKPGVPFGGNYRIIDFVMNNFINSGIKNIKVLTQTRSQSVKQHIERLYPSSPLYGHFIDTVPAQQKSGQKWYEGTADAVYQNLDLFQVSGFETAAIFAGDHVFTMDIRQMLNFHSSKKANFTICAIPFPVEKAASQLGVIEVDENYRVIGFEEKPKIPKEIPGMSGMCFASMGNYLGNIKIISDILVEDSKNEKSGHDFGKNVIPLMIKKGLNIFAYNFNKNKIVGQNNNYWRDVGTIKAYWEANMDLKEIKPEINLFNTKNWPIRTFPDSLPPFKCGLNPQLNNNLIGSGCIINGCKIFESVLSQSILVEKRSKIIDSIIFSGVKIGEDVEIYKTIIDKDVVIPSGVKLNPSIYLDDNSPIKIIDGILIIPKGCNLESIGY